MGNCTSNNQNIEAIHLKQLQSCTYETADEMTYQFTKAKVIKVYDGDTITIAAFMNDSIVKFNVRIYGIDCAEIKGGTVESKKQAQKAKQYVSNMLLGKIIDIDVLNGKLYNGKKIHEKYGRLLAIVIINGVSIADELIKLGLAREYFGGKKLKPDIEI